MNPETSGELGRLSQPQVRVRTDKHKTLRAGEAQQKVHRRQTVQQRRRQEGMTVRSGLQQAEAEGALAGKRQREKGGEEKRGDLARCSRTPLVTQGSCSRGTKGRRFEEHESSAEGAGSDGAEGEGRR